MTRQLSEFSMLVFLVFGGAPLMGATEKEEGIYVGGAVRFQYSFEEYNAGNEERGGDIDLDTVRLDFDGIIGDMILSAEFRYYQYMQVIHHAWVGYDFNDLWQGQVGITKVPFGILPYNSHNFFFSSNYYLGLEDDYDTGIKALFESGPWDMQLAFFKNDELGGVDGFVDNRSDRYSYDVVGERTLDEGTFAEPAIEIGEVNTLVGRLAYTFGYESNFRTELGTSGLAGSLNDGDGSVGNYSAYALHLDGLYGRWNLQLQAAQYQYDLDSGREQLAVGAYSFFDTIPSKGTTYTANIAYGLPVSWGPITLLTFYSDNSLITDKSAHLDDTIMNIVGVSISAGPVFTYIDIVSAENQPFIGGSIGSNSNERNTRINVNVGYYF